MILTIRPITAWPGELRTDRQRLGSPFNSSYMDTMELLDRELRMVRATVTVIQLAINEGQISRGGRLRATVRPDHPGVILSFDTRAGHFRYTADRFTHWHANLRGIALGLEALRKFERYGIGSGTEQFTGFLQLEAAPGEIRTVEQARAFMASVGDYRSAARRFHPDGAEGGNEAMFKRLNDARSILDAARD